MSQRKLLQHVEDMNLDEEELAEFAALILNLGTMSMEGYMKFKETLKDDNWNELEERIQNGD